MSLKRDMGSVEYMMKRIPKNEKYKHVKSKLDTGCSLTKYMERLEEIKTNYRYRKDELFKRLKVTTFAQMILQVASISDLNESELDGESHVPDDSPSLVAETDLERLSEHTNGSPQPLQLSDRQYAGDTGEICYSARSSLQSVISGVGELSLNKNHQKIENESASSCDLTDRPYHGCPYLLLDVRDQDEYDRCHIISARSFPIAMLCRTVNPYTKDVLEYRNAKGKIIIVYDEDESISNRVATILCERGFENVFVLSGGLKVISQKFPEGLVTGSFPIASSPTLVKRKKSSVPPQQPSQLAEKRQRFTSDELNKIQEELDELLIPSNSNSRMSSSMSSRMSSSMSSRMSSSMSKSKSSSARSRNSSSTAGRDSARVQSSRVWK